MADGAATLSLRPPTDADWSAIHALARSSVAGVTGAGDQADWLRNRRNFDPTRGLQRHFVAERAGRLEGYGSLESGAGSVPSSYRLFVVAHPDAYAGVGQTLYERLCRELSALDATEAWWIEHAGDTVVVPFVRARGFEEVRRFRLANGLEAVVLSKSLRSRKT